MAHLLEENETTERYNYSLSKTNLFTQECYMPNTTNMPGSSTIQHSSENMDALFFPKDSFLFILWI